jgi:Tol biopolymer transport system component/DNA-binding winged helix-turn-helix (wHTH) protein
MIKSSVSGPGLVRFDTFEFDVISGDLREAGVRLNLQEQPLHLLAALVERPGKLVTRDELRHRLWPADTFVDFDHGLNAAVKRLRDALGDSADAPRYVETVPRRGYRFIAPVHIVIEPADETGSLDAPSPIPIGPALETRSEPQPRRRWGPLAVGGVAIVILVIGMPWLSRTFRVSSGSPPAMRLVAVTTMNGYQAGELSPDGRQVAFEWNGDREDNWDIYVKFVGSSDMRRLTTDPGADVGPAWSHDGQQIAYLHTASGDPPDSFDPPESSPQRSGRVRVMSAMGGADRQVSDLLISGSVQWSPDDRYVIGGRAVQPGVTASNAGIYLIPLQGGEPRAVTRPKPTEIHRSATFSRDGRRLAYVSCENFMGCQLYVLDVGSTFAGVGPPRQVTRFETMTFIKGVSWSQDGRSLIYGATEMRSPHLWRMNVDGTGQPERIEMAGAGAAYPSVSSTGDRLMFTRLRLVDDRDIYRVEQGRSPEPVARSSKSESNVQFSNDGQRIAFCSDRSSDTAEVWVANADGSAPEQLTHGPGLINCSPSWSPDGEHIAFDSEASDGSWHIWMVDRQGGSLHQVTGAPGDQNHPTWSRDGKWIYFSWRQPAERDFWHRDIWRTRPETGENEHVTQGAQAALARESLDGTTVFFRATMPAGPLQAKPVAGGPVRTVISCVTGTAISVTKAGIYYLPCQANRVTTPTVHLLDPVTGADREAGKLENYSYQPTPGAFAVSPDGHVILYERQVRAGADLMMIENFR